MSITVTASTLKELKAMFHSTLHDHWQKKNSNTMKTNVTTSFFDIETNTTRKSAELCQLSVADLSGLHQFLTHILPVQDIDYFASKV